MEWAEGIRGGVELGQNGRRSDAGVDTQSYYRMDEGRIPS